MSNVLSELLREKQSWIERTKCRPSYWSRIFNVLIAVGIGFVVVKLIENPNILWDLVKMFS